MRRARKDIREKAVRPLRDGVGQKREKAGFTLLELMLAAMILTGALMALVGVSVYCFNLAETNYNTTIAYNNAREQIESIFSSVGSIVEDNVTFDPTSLDGKGRIEITEASPDVFQVRVVVCWRQRGGRIIGEDSNLNGTLDAGEDSDGDGVLDSPCELITLMTKA